MMVYVLVTTKVIKYESRYDEATSNIKGIILDYNIDGDKLSLQIKGKEKIVANYYFDTEEEKKQISEKLRLGATVNLEGTLTKPSNNTIPNTFNYKEYLKNKHIYYIFNISNIKILNNDIGLLYQIKNKVIERVNSFKKTGKYMQAFILGDKDYIEEDVYSTYQNNGVTHLFAVSGMHVGLLVVIMGMIMQKLKIKELFININVCLFLIFYMFLIGFTASVVRASLLYIALLINKKLDLKIPSINILYIIGMFLLLVNPFYIYDLGFIYSFLTAFGLMLFSKKITGNYLVKLFKVSLMAFLFSLPVTIANFYEFNILTILNNIVIVPIVSSILFPLTLLTFILPFLENVLILGFNILEVISKFLNTFRINIVVGKCNIFFIISYYLIIYLIYKKGFKNIIILGILILVLKYSYLWDNNDYVYFLDVGQGDSSLIVSARHQDLIMIDTGGVISYNKSSWQVRNKTFNLADNIVTFLKSLGITKLDLMVFSHGDMDHLGYAKDILKEIKTDKLMFNNNDYNYQESELLKTNIKVIKDSFQGKRVAFQNLNKLVLKDENDSSLVLYLILDKIKFLYMGDAPTKVEEEIIKQYDITTDVLKIGHHGSNTSSDKNFLKKVQPNISIISAGRGNRYGHPHQETIDKLNSLNLKYYMTKEKGTIKMTLKKGIKKISFWSP